MSKYSDESLENKKYEDMKHMTRGETPEDIRDKCLKLCAEYLGGSWNEITAEQIIVRRISGGYTNQLYYCGLPQGISPIKDEPKEVAIKLYGKKWISGREKNERMPDMVIVLLASEFDLGPKIYGLFNEGEIEEYVEVIKKIFSISIVITLFI
jgi:choline/ethanolamine kinase